MVQCRLCAFPAHSETRPNLLMLLGLNFAVFSESLLMRKENCSDFDSAIPRFESWRPSHTAVHKCSRSSALVHKRLKYWPNYLAEGCLCLSAIACSRKI
jgi:hypothetical protein